MKPEAITEPRFPMNPDSQVLRNPDNIESLIRSQREVKAGLTPIIEEAIGVRDTSIIVAKRLIQHPREPA